MSSTPSANGLRVTSSSKSPSRIRDVQSNITSEPVQLQDGAQREDDTASLPPQKLVYGSEEMDAILRERWLIPTHQGLYSCPELGHRHKHSPQITPPLTISPHDNRRRASISQPVTPTSLRTRVEDLFRRARSWRSPPGSSQSISPNPPPEPERERKFQTGKERRRRARDSGKIRGSSTDGPVPIFSAPTAEEGTRPLAVAGVVLGTSDLDRLSLMAREDEGKSKHQGEQA